MKVGRAPGMPARLHAVPAVAMMLGVAVGAMLLASTAVASTAVASTAAASTAVAAAGTTVTDDAGHAGRVTRLMGLLGLPQLLPAVAERLVGEDARLGQLPAAQRACVVGATQTTLEHMMRERLAERMTRAQVQEWLNFAATPEGTVFVDGFASGAPFQTASTGSAQQASKAEAFMGTMAFMALIRALEGEPTFSYQQSNNLHRKFQSDCDVRSPQEP